MLATIKILAAQYMGGKLALLFMGLMILVVSPANAVERGIVFFKHGDYKIFDTKTTSEVGKGNLFELVYGESKKATSDSIIDDVIVDYDNHYVIARLLRLQSEDHVGFLVYKWGEYPRLFTHIGFIPATGDLAIDSKNSFFYVNKNSSVVEIYDKTINKVKILNNKTFLIGRSLCFLDGGKRIYSNGKYFRASNGEILGAAGGKNRNVLPWASTRCDKGKIVFISIAGDKIVEKNNKVSLTYYDVEDNRALANIVLPMNVSGINSEEWYLPNSVETVIRNEYAEKKSVYGGIERYIPGRLYFVDFASGEIQFEVQVPVASYGVENRILGDSGDGKRILYSTIDSVFLINAEAGTIEKEIKLPARAVGVVWP